MALITCKNAVFTYDGKIAAENLDFVIQSGDYLCIVGENGEGKSTLIKGLLRLKKPVEGEIFTGDGLAMNQIGYLPQQNKVQKDFPASVGEVVLSGCLNGLGFQPFYTKRQKGIVEENMERLGILSLRKRCYRELSGGQQQRVLLARALCATKKMLLLDEPAAGLDPLMTNELYRMIEKINKELQITVVMVSHDIPCAVKYADHILHLQREQLFFGTLDEYLKSEVGHRFTRGGKDA